MEAPYPTPLAFSAPPLLYFECNAAEKARSVGLTIMRGGSKTHDGLIPLNI